MKISHTEQDKIKELLLGRRIQKVSDDQLLLDNGVLVAVVPNQGGCACSAGDYYLKRISDSIDAIVTSVEFEYEPTGDFDWSPDKEHGDGYYRIYVIAAEERINLFSVEGDDGNGYYGTGFELWVKKAEE